MGLDGVELVMALEEAFGVELKDSDVAEAVTPRLLGDVIFAKLRSTNEKICQSQRAFYLLRRAFMRHFRLPRSAVTPDMPFRRLIPRSREKELWADLKRSVYARRWPGFTRPQWLRWALVALVIGSFCITFGVLWRVFPIGAGNAAALGVAATIVVSVLAEKATRRFRTRIPARVRRIRDIVPFAVTSDEVKWTREQVSVLVKQVVLDQLGIPETKYREDAHFVKDLGIS